MTIDTIKWGETYDIQAQAGDVDGVPIVMDGTWSAAVLITRQLVGGATVAEPAMTMVDGAATCSIDTGSEGWAPGVYYYDVRLTDPDGNDYWCEAVKLVVENRNSPSSA